TSAIPLRGNRPHAEGGCGARRRSDQPRNRRPRSPHLSAHRRRARRRAAAASFIDTRFGVTVDPATEVVSLIGSKEGIANMAVAFVDPRDVVLVPDPGYPVYHIGTQFNGGVTYRMPLRPENGFVPDLAAVPDEVARRAKLLWLNYPNNPTAAVAPRSFLCDAIRFAERHDIILCHDAAYAEVYFGERPPSVLELPGGRDVAIEFHSLSKTFNMTGWRVGFAALRSEPAVVEGLRAMYRERRDVLVGGLRDIGLPCDPPAGTFYVWCPVPRGQTVSALATRCLQEAGV